MMEKLNKNSRLRLFLHFPIQEAQRRWTKASRSAIDFLIFLLGLYFILYSYISVSILGIERKHILRAISGLC